MAAQLHIRDAVYVEARLVNYTARNVPICRGRVRRRLSNYAICASVRRRRRSLDRRCHRGRSSVERTDALLISPIQTDRRYIMAGLSHLSRMA